MSRGGTRPARYQVRLQFDERSGELWSWLQNTPERARPNELHILIQLGLRLSRGLRDGNTTLLQPMASPTSQAREATTAPVPPHSNAIEILNDWALDPGFDALVARDAQHAQ